jgi:hypothetical protein
MAELVQFVRNRNGQPRGVLVARNEGVSWSALHPRDSFDKELALRIARGRIENGCNTNPPRHVQNALPRFIDRAQRYFRRQF